jgi:hypothetical protein
VNALWVIGAIGLVAAVIAIVTSWRRAEHLDDLGAVSNQWIAEHRLGAGQDSRR